MTTGSFGRFLMTLVAALVVLAAATLAWAVTTGLSARVRPGAIERTAARTIRNAAIAVRTRGMTNPAPGTPDAIAEGMAHFADHCAVCHATDGSGDTEMNRGLYPPAPDLRLPATQRLSDAELFYIIENGVRLTGMPGWGNATKEGELESWHLVDFIRHLPALSTAEQQQMDDLIPRTPAEMKEREEEKAFLDGGDAAPDDAAPTTSTTHQHAGAHE
ncbi:MAG TPA: c-type cytochrome [Vicinamibacterales bacterium]|nr:c-type cytochrome [Vicinamibacterales bacterium]